jgi:phosphopantothenoylcysteine decarboxylase / phosphopantothenate---cysteine ligase
MSKLSSKKILITAGPTREPIDPVRFISNYSSGKMGLALAESAANLDAEVTLVLGPTDLKISDNRIKVIEVQTAAEMFDAVAQYFPQSDVIIFAAAVADYTPKHPAGEKIKKNETEFVLELMKTKDIALEMGKIKNGSQCTVGFALETNAEMENATSKLNKKNLDFIVLNSLRDAGAGFQSDTNKITILDKSGNVIKFDLKPKTEVAADILNYIEKCLP